MATPDLPALAALRAFEAVGRLGGVRRAATALGVDHAVVSRHLRALEHQLGLPLYDRAAGCLTRAGRDYHARIASALGEIAAATAALGAGRQELCIWCSPGIAAPWLTSRLAGFAAGGGQVLDLRASDRPPDFARDEADGDVRYSSDATLADEGRGLRCVTLARPPVFPVVAPGLARAMAGRVGSARDLLAMPLIEESGSADWALWLAAHGVADLPASRVGRYGNAHLALTAARSGQGVALGNHYLVADDLAAGRLVPLLDGGGSGRVAAAIGSYVFRSDEIRWGSPAVKRFRQWLVGQFQRDPPPGEAIGDAATAG